MARSAKEALAVEKMDVVADMGYYDGQEVKACLEEGIIPYIPKANTSANRKRGLFTKEDFRYDAQRDRYLCPAGETLNFRFQTVELGREIRYYATRACQRCALKAKCTRNKSGRRITRWVDEHLLEAMQARVRAQPEKVGLRKCLAEHPFGTIKHGMNQGYFLMRGLPKVRAEMALTALAYRPRSLTAQPQASDEDPGSAQDGRSPRLGGGFSPIRQVGLPLSFKTSRVLEFVG